MLFLECTKLVEGGQPILAVPRAHDLSIFEFMDVDGLNGHPAVLRWEAHELRALRSGQLRPDHDFVSVLKYLRGNDREIRKRPGQIVENEFDALSAGRLARGGRNIYPVFAYNLLGEGRLSLVEDVVPNSDVVHGGALLLSMSRKAEHQAHGNQHILLHCLWPVLPMCQTALKRPLQGSGSATALREIARACRQPPAIRDQCRRSRCDR